MSETLDSKMQENTSVPADPADGEPNVAQFSGSALAPEELERLTTDIVAALKTVYDPEIPVDIYELGLIYKIDIEDNYLVKVDMTLTAPGCPVAGEMPIWVRDAIATVQGVMDVDVELVFDPPWTPERMSEEAQIGLGWF